MAEPNWLKFVSSKFEIYFPKMFLKFHGQRRTLHVGS